jgi:ribose transport system substrate-binding protein
MHINYKLLSLVLALALATTSLAACGNSSTSSNAGSQDSSQPKEARTYYLCSSHQAHPYFADSHLGLRYAAEHFQVNIIAAGPEGWDTTAQAEAIEQAIAKKPAGIITRMWDDSPAEAVKKAMGEGIPVVLTETRTENNPGLCYIGLDNTQCGRDTGAELVKRAGDSGKLAIMGNWGAANTDAKLKGLKYTFRSIPDG